MKGLLANDIRQSPYKTIARLAWPQVVMNFFHFFIGFVDVWVAGQLGRNVQASIGLTTQAVFFFLVVAIAFANGSVAAISQSMGAGLYRRIQRYVGLGLESGLVLGLVLLGFGLLLEKLLPTLLRIPSDIAPIATDLFEIYVYLLPSYYLFIISNAIFRAQQRVMYPLYAVCLVAVVNTLGDFALGLGYWGFPKFGYKGLAWTTFLAVNAGTVFNLCVLYRHRLLVRKSFAPLRWVRRAFPYLFRVAMPAALMQLVWHSAYMVLFAITGSLPRDSVIALAGMSAGLRVESLFFLPAMAFNFTAAIIVGHHLGARDPGEARRCGYRILGVGMAVVAVILVLVWNSLPKIAAFVASDPEVHKVTLSYLKYNLAGLPFLLVGMVLGGAFTGAGATLYQMLCVGGSAWLVRIPLAWFLGHRIIGGADGIWMAMLASMIVQAVVVLLVYHYGDWPKFSMQAEKIRSRPLVPSMPRPEVRT
jgi:putative MATE family efflux protein